MTKKPILEIDARGWGRLQANLPKPRLFFELFQNSKDEDGTTAITITLEPVPNRPLVRFAVEDDGPGFDDLRHAYTLFAPSGKLGSPTKSGFMNMGEKSVVVGATRVTVETTTGTIEFDMGDATRLEYPRRRRVRGTVVSGEMRMTREELEDTVRALHTLLVPAHITLRVNGVRVAHQPPLRSFPARLPTRVLDDTGELVTRTRDTTVEIYPVAGGVTPALYELGIPVVDCGLAFHVNIGQKVILNKDRDNVTPAYARAVRVLVLNRAADLLTEQDASADWVRSAAGDDEAVSRVFNLRFGPRRVVASVTDPEANYNAVAHGYTLIHSRTLSEGERANARRFGLAPPSHAVFPTPKPYSDDPSAPPVEVVPPSGYTRGMQRVVAYTEFLGQELLGFVPAVRVVKAQNFRAAYGSRTIDFSGDGLGWSWFDYLTDDTDALILHEFAHEFEGNHLSEDYHRAICRLAAFLKRLALERPEAFHRFAA